ncbi:MAG: hypothetical protein ACXWOT_02095 [Candidatus Limnocylindrales bacterium]
MAEPIAIYLEVGSKRTFAGVVEWPGWCRGGRGEREALLALAGYAARYGLVAAAAALPLAAHVDPDAFQVVERLQGGAGTDFGVPGRAPAADERQVDEVDLGRLLALLDACWGAFDDAARAARGVALRTGPRGGGRDLAKIVAHVGDAEAAYLVKLGARPPKGDASAVSGRPDPATTLAPVRAAGRDALRARALGLPIAAPAATRTLWSPRYFVRRAAWHVLDHAWEIEDRAIR